MSETESLNSIINSEALNTDPTSSDRFRFTEIDIRHSFRKDATPDEIRRFSQDKSWLLRTVLDQVGSARLLGEFQLAFLVIFVGQNFAGLEHWKRILHMVLGSSDVMTDPRIVDDVIVSVLRILGQQLRECPREFVASVLEQDNFVAEILQMLVLNVYESEQCAARGVLEPEIARLRELLGTFDWVLPEGCQLKEEADLEEGEYAPQIVDL
ncbi:hypothetical protein GGF43_003487 [Coemansia sp. RSA 2618]|nr:hypothetical protein GGF43_003487 [Coemansia sp. RSA 2618]